MPWKHVVAPTKGLITNQPSTGLPDQASPNMSGVILKNGEVQSDFGMIDYPVPGVLKTNALNGTFMGCKQLILLDGTSYLIAFTTTHIYSYNTGTNTWDVLTKGNLLDNCEDAWVEGTSIVNSANGDVKLRGTYSSKNILLDYVPILHFPMDDDAADTDVEETGSDLTCVASVNTSGLSTAGVVDDCFNFELDTGLYVNADTAFTDATVIDDTTGTIAVWLRPESMAADMAICSWADTSANGRLILKVLATGEISAEMHNGTATQWQITSPAATVGAGAWYHVVLRQDGTSPTITVNNVAQTITNVVSTDLTTWIADIAGLDNGRIACHSYNGGGNAEFYDGLMDDLRYYSSTITDREIDGLYNAANGTGSTGTAGAFVPRVFSSEAPATADISDAINTHLSFWIYSDIAIAAEVLSMRLSEQALGGTGATYADYYIPALVAGEWQHITVAIATPDADDGGDYPDDLNAVATIALVGNSDPGACIIYIDDVRTCTCFTGDEDNRWSAGTLNDLMIITNGVDAPSQIYVDGTLEHIAITLTLPTGELTTCEVVIPFKDHMLYFNNTENGGNAPQRCSWSNIGDVTDMVAGTAGFQDLLDDDSWVVGAVMLAENEIIVYKERSVVSCSWVGGHTPFRFKTIANGIGAINKDCIASIYGTHHVMGSKTMYKHNISGTTPMNASIKRTIYERIDGTYSDRAFMFGVEMDDELQIWLPVGATTPDEGYSYNFTDDNWYLKDRNISGFGFYVAQSSLTIGDLVGTIGEQNWTFGSQLTKAFLPITLVGDTNGKVYQLSKSTLNNAGVAITNEWETPDFVLPGIPEYMNQYMRTMQFIYEARGQSVTTTYSTDGGATWGPTQGGGTNIVALDSTFKSYQQDFESNSKRIRFKFSNTNASSGFQLRYYGFFWVARSERK